MLICGRWWRQNLQLTAPQDRFCSTHIALSESMYLHTMQQPLGLVHDTAILQGKVSNMCSTEVVQPLLWWKSKSEAIQTQACGVLCMILLHGFAQVRCKLVLTLDV